MSEEAGASAKVEDAHQSLESQIGQLALHAMSGRVSTLADFIEANMKEPRREAEKKRASLDEVTPARRILTPDQEKTVMDALILAVNTSYRHANAEAVAGMLRRENVPEYVKVEVVWACEKLGWAAPLRAWMPTTREICAEGVRKSALGRIDEKYRVLESPPDKVVPLRPPQRPAARPEGTRLTGRY